MKMQPQIITRKSPVRVCGFPGQVGGGTQEIVGRRAGCHSICWMAPFMLIGRWIRNRFGWPALQLQADASACTDCRKCTTNCPMSLDVNGMVKAENMENPECILCGTCVDGCPARVIRYAFARAKGKQET